MIGIKSEALLLFRKFITSKTPSLLTRSLYLGTVLNDSTDQQGEASSSNDVKKVKKRRTPDVREICEYFNATGHDFTNIIHQLPTRIAQQRKTVADHLYLVDNNIAESIVSMIKSDLLADPHKVVEVNAGIGLITEKLISAGIPLITIMELHVKFIQRQAQLQKIHPDRIMICEADLLHIWKMAYQDKQDDGKRVETLFSMFPPVKWGDELGLKIIGAVTNINFIRHLILDVVRQCGLVTYGRPCLYFAVPPSVWLRLTCDRSTGFGEYRSIAVLFQLFFDYKILGKVPRKAYLPWTPNSVAKRPTRLALQRIKDKEDMYVVKIEGKKNLFTEMINGEQIQPLWYFVNHHMVARTGRVIPHMEAWQPGCGPTLIMQDYNIFTEFGDLSPQQVLKLFKEFTSWDGYQNSFLPSMENSPAKMEQLLF